MYCHGAIKLATSLDKFFLCSGMKLMLILQKHVDELYYTVRCGSTNNITIKIINNVVVVAYNWCFFSCIIVTHFIFDIGLHAVCNMPQANGKTYHANEAYVTHYNNYDTFIYDL